MRKGFIVLAVLGAVFAAAPAIAQVDAIEIHVSGIAHYPEGTVLEVARQTVPESLIGATCSATASTENNASPHPGNDFIISSGGSAARIPNWEEVPGASVSMTGTLTLGNEVVVELRLGPDEISSGGVLIVLSCAQPEPPTTTTTTTTTTQPPPPETTTTVVVTTTDGGTTTEPPPEGGVEAGGGKPSSGNPAEPWVGGGALLLAAALALTAFGRQIASKRD